MKIPKFVNVVLVVETESNDTDASVERSIKGIMTEIMNSPNEPHKLVAFDILSIENNIKFG